MKWCKAIIKCGILHVKRKKYYFSLFLPYFWFLIKYKMATMFGDVTDLPPPPLFLVPLWGYDCVYI